MKNVRLQILDIAKGTSISSKFEYFKETLKLSREEIIDLQQKKLQSLVLHAYNTVPYYRNLFDQIGIKPEDIKSIDDLKLLPVLDRDIIQKERLNLVSESHSIEQMHMGSSSGTTGIPINYYFDKESLSYGSAAGVFLWSLAGKQPGDKNFYIWGNESSIKRWNTMASKLKNLLIHQRNIASTLIDDEKNCIEIANKLQKFKPKFIEGYPGAIYTLAKFIQTKNLNVKGIKGVLTTAENLEEYQKELIEKIFGPTADLYGSGEVLGIAVRPVNDDKYYILDPHVILETQTNSIDGSCDLIVTDLDNYGMPKLRYKIGDMVDSISEPDYNSKFPFAYFKKIMGRNSDIITLPNGMKFHPVNIFGGTTFRRFTEITRHKVIWNNKNLEIVLETSDLSNKESILDVIEEILKKYQISYKVSFTEKIFPSASGKYRYMEIKQ